MSQHVFSWVAGFGWTLMPLAPFRFARVAGEPRSVRVRHDSPTGPHAATVTVRADGTVEWRLALGTERLGEVLDLIEGAAYDHWTTAAAYDDWRIETYAYTICWPEGFALASIPADSPPVFDLIGPDDARIWVQGPVREAAVPPPGRMEGAGQRTERVWESAGGTLSELVYEHEGEAWRMFHCRVDRNPPRRSGFRLPFLREPPRYLCLVTAQTPERWAGLVRDAVVEAAASLAPCPEE